jgi:dihydroorotase
MTATYDLIVRNAKVATAGDLFVCDLAITGGRIVDPSSGLDRVASLHLAHGRIAAVGDAPDGFRADRSLDATGLVVCPGLVDLSARLREPGFEY